MKTGGKVVSIKTSVVEGGEANQNAISKVKVNGTIISTTVPVDTLNITSGQNITLVPDAANKSIEISSKDTTYGIANESALGLVKSSNSVSVDTQGNMTVNPAGHQHTIAEVTGLSEQLNSKIRISQINVPEGVAGLDGNGKIYSDLLPDNPDIGELMSYINYSKTDVIGVELDLKNNTCTRLAGAVGHEGGEDFWAENFNAYNRRRCMIDMSSVNFSVYAYYGDANFTYNKNINYQIMVEQPAFYYRVEPIELEANSEGIGYIMRKVRYYISNTPRVGFKLHPAFIENGKINDKIYLSAFRNCLVQVGAEGQYFVTDDSEGINISNKASMLYSVSGCKPLSGDKYTTTIDLCRQAAQKISKNWFLTNVPTISATQLLFLIEYASLNIQQKIGIGHTNGTWNNINDTQPTGSTNELGNLSGHLINPNTSINSMSYRGEEDLYGMWQFIDGLTIENNGKCYPYICLDTNYTNDKITDNYVSTGFTLSHKEGYISALGYGNKDFDYIFMPSETKGTSSGIIGDYFYQNTNATYTTIGPLGGSWDGGSAAGLSYWSVNVGSGFSSPGVGARVRFVPNC